LRKLYETLSTYSPPLELIRRLSPDAPVLARRLRESANKGKVSSWWNNFKVGNRESGSNLKDEGKGEGKREMSESERERALVRVLSGEEELAELDVPKVSTNPVRCRRILDFIVHQLS
jgi:protein AFG1